VSDANDLKPADDLTDGNREEAASLGPEDFETIISKEIHSDWGGRRISGKVSLRGRKFEFPIEFRGAIFTDDVDFSQARFERGLDLSDCHFEQKLLLRGTRVAGPLVLDRVKIGTPPDGPTPPPAESTAPPAESKPQAAESTTPGAESTPPAAQSTAPALAQFDNLRVVGCFNMVGGRVFGQMYCPGIRVEAEMNLSTTEVSGDVVLSGANVESDLTLTGCAFGGQVYMENVRISGDFNCDTRSYYASSFSCLGSIYLLGGKVDGHASFEGASLQGSLFLENTNVGKAILLRSTATLEKNVRCQIISKVWLLGVTTGGDLDISGAEIGDDLILQNANLGQNFRACMQSGFRCEIGGDLVLTGASVRGTVDIKGIRLAGALNADRASIGGAFQVTFDLDQTRQWQIVRSAIQQRLYVDSATIGKQVLLMGLELGAADSKQSEGVQEISVSFSGAQTSGEFSLYSPKLGQEILADKMAEYKAAEITPEIRDAILQQASTERTVVYGNLHLNRAQLSGGVVLDGAAIEGDLDMRDSSVKAHLNCKAIRGEQAQFQRSSIHHVLCEALDMIGDIDLTGLDIIGPGDGRNGDLNARDARIRGRVELYPYHSTYTDVVIDNMAKLSGNLLLDAASISHLIISGANFVLPVAAPTVEPERDMFAWLNDKTSSLRAIGGLLWRGGEKEQIKPIRLGLERAMIGRLQVIQPLPGPLDLSNLKVDRWDLDLDSEPAIYQKLLSESYPFKRSNYFGIENALRNEGLDEKADQVNVSMRRRDRQTTKSRLVILLDAFLDLSIKYGTTSKRLVFIILALFFMSLLAFRNPNHVEYKNQPNQPAAKLEDLQFVTGESEHQQNGLTEKRYLTRAAAVPGQAAAKAAPMPWSIKDSALYAARLNLPIISLGLEDRVQPRGFGWKVLSILVIAASWVIWPLLIGSMSGLIRKRN
jgi:hypothetical protein